jgi:hypothetical protein
MTTDANYPRRGEFRPISELPDSVAPAWVEVEDASGAPGVAPYVGGGGDPWQRYGFPAWRTNFNDPSGFADWTVIQGSKANLAFRTQGAYCTSGDLWLGRTVPDAPFVFDVRYTLSFRADVATYRLHCGVTGTLAPNRRWAWLALLNSSSASLQVATATYNDTAPISETVVLGYLADSAMRIQEGFTLRVWYDGTHYRSYLASTSPLATEQPNVSVNTVQPVLTTGTPVGVWFNIPSAPGAGLRCQFAQFQTVNLDRWAGM